MADREARGAAGEAPVGDQGARLAQPARFQIAGRIEHFLHARAAARPFVADDDHVARLDLAAQDALHRVVLALEDARRAVEHEIAGVDPRGLHDGAVERDVAVEHGEAAILGEGMLGIADDALLAILVERGIARDWLNATWVGTPPGPAIKNSRVALPLAR